MGLVKITVTMITDRKDAEFEVIVSANTNNTLTHVSLV